MFFVFSAFAAQQNGVSNDEAAAQNVSEPPRQIRIRNIDIKTRNVFAREDTASRPMYRLFNWLRWPTREEVIRRELWFGEGDVVMQAELEEFERNLRALGIFGEVRIEQVRVANGDTGLRIATARSVSFALKPLPATYLTFAASGSGRWYVGTTQDWSQSAALHAFQQSLPR